MVLLFSPLANAFDEKGCEKSGVTIIGIVRDDPAGDPIISINGKAVAVGKELSAIRNSCGKYMVVMLSPKATMRDFIDFGFLASKSGFHENSEKYLPFVYSSDKTRMTYLKSMAVVKFTDDPDQLEKLAEAPPKNSGFL
ncbi:hypothetical protein [Xanthomonas cannabis]|uniref:hypothetical protein n=1 Tax=Xanthomonas cannabis TaxID=1885674 RepID=UPI001641702A|nr:hypothetical protein [Xanthomonas cannabis]